VSDPQKKFKKVTRAKRTAKAAKGVKQQAAGGGLRETGLAHLLQGAKGQGIATSSVARRNTVFRVRYFHAQIRDGKYPNCRVMAERFGVCTRTVERDAAALRDTMGLPLAFCFRRNGYYYTEPVASDLPRPKMSPGDALAFCLARRALERFSGTDFAAQFDAALATITSEVEGEVDFQWEELDKLVSFGTGRLKRVPNPAVAAPVSEGLLKQQELSLMYWTNGTPKHARRRIHPLHLRAVGDALILFAIDPDREDGVVRRFVLSRMKQVQVTTRKFERPADFDPDVEMEHSIGAYRGDRPERVRLRLSALVTRLLDERPLHATQQIVPLKAAAAQRKSKKPAKNPGLEMMAELTMRVAITPELEREILRWGLDVEVLEPKSLKAMVLATARGILARG
jgi:predicted DNA-binding transcriptional regulator YafY